MEDITRYAESTSKPAESKKETKESIGSDVVSDKTGEPGETDSQDIIELIEKKVIQEVEDKLKTSITKDVVREVINNLSIKFLDGEKKASLQDTLTKSVTKEVEEKPAIKVKPAATDRIKDIKSFTVPKQTSEVPIQEVKLGATKEEGGTRGRTFTIGGETCMPFHLWEGDMPNAPLIAMEVFDKVSEKFPPVLREKYGDILDKPAEMAKICIDKYGADLISVRLEGTHPEKGNKPPEQAVDIVKTVLEAVDVPLIITGHNHFESNNEVFKAVASACAGENLLLNWVEQDNYRTIAGAAIAYGHSLVSQSPIDVNIGKQQNILLTNMDFKREKIVMDPMTGASGYGIEYTYSVMERIRQTGLNGDKMLAFPMIVTPGQECAKIKEFKAPEEDFPAWGDLAKRAALWELSTAVPLLYAGADLFIMYHPEAVRGLKRTINQLLQK
jgi:acetyl-CoA decarbonylase/synthase complex subunit delta